MKKTVYVLILAMASMALCSGCGGGADMAMAEQQTVAITVETQEIEPLSIEQYVTVSSKVSAENEVSVVPKVSGTVKNVYVSLGDTVKAGDILFEIDDTDAQLQLAEAQASLTSAQAGLKSSQAGLESAQAEYEKNIGGSYETQLQQMRSNVDTYQIQYDDLLKELEQTKELYELGGASEKEVNDLQSSVDKAKLQLETAKEELELNEGKILEETKKSSQASVNQSEASVSQSEASISQSMVSVESAQKQLNDTKVRAEIDGTISSLNVSAGSTVSTQSEAATIVDMDRVKVAFNVSEDVINRISVGSTAYITISAVSNEPYEVQIASLSPSADADTKLYAVEAYIDNPSGEIKPGMFASIKLVLEERENTVSVPLNTVIQQNDEKYVYVVDSDNIAHKTTVETGLENDEYIEITSGLNMGDIVVVSGQDFLSDGSTVSIQNGNSSSEDASSNETESKEENSSEGSAENDSNMESGETPASE